MFSLLRKILPKNLAGILGIIQVIIPLARELVMAIIRILAVLMPQKINDELVAKVRGICDAIEKGFENFKNFFLNL